MHERPAGSLLGCAPNFRDVAETAPGLRPGLLFRSDAILDPDDADASRLREYGIRLVIDLRSDQERKSAPNHWWTANGVEIAEFDVAASGDPGNIMASLINDPSVAGAHRMMVGAYASFAAGILPMLRFLGEKLEAGALPVMLHCTAGKDRTGVSVALLLIALGIAREHVHHDYLASNGRVQRHAFEATRAMMQARMDEPLEDAALAAVCGVHLDFLDSAFKAIDASHGSVEAWLLDAGFDERRRAALRQALIL
jgi:protein-tyrosine phosphatase